MAWVSVWLVVLVMLLLLARKGRSGWRRWWRWRPRRCRLTPPDGKELKRREEAGARSKARRVMSRASRWCGKAMPLLPLAIKKMVGVRAGVAHRQAQEKDAIHTLALVRT